jgi:hypothetical protein
MTHPVVSTSHIKFKQQSPAARESVLEFVLRQNCPADPRRDGRDSQPGSR